MLSLISSSEIGGSLNSMRRCCHEFPAGRLGRVLVLYGLAVVADEPVRPPWLVALLVEDFHVLLHAAEGLERLIGRAIGVDVTVDDHPVVRALALGENLERAVPGAFGVIADMPAQRLDRIEAGARQRQLDVAQDFFPEMPVPSFAEDLFLFLDPFLLLVAVVIFARLDPVEALDPHRAAAGIDEVVVEHLDVGGEVEVLVGHPADAGDHRLALVQYVSHVRFLSWICFAARITGVRVEINGELDASSQNARHFVQ